MNQIFKALFYNFQKFSSKSLYKIFLAYILYKSYQKTKALYDTKKLEWYWEKQIKEYRENRETRFQNILYKIQLQSNDLSPDAIEKILNASVVELKKMLEDGECTSVQLVNIFTKRSLEIGEKNNYITEVNYAEAHEMAVQCDAFRKQDKSKCQGELFGIPISVKDCIIQKNQACTLGAAARINSISEDDGLVLKVIRQSGAIPFVRTNVPQMMLAAFTTNYVYGSCKNPWDEKRTCGGSSGGEGGLLAARCSPVGIGSDIGGSIRYPASFTGLYGFKPGNHRLTSMGSCQRSKQTYGNGTIATMVGPMGKYVDDNVEYMRAMLNAKYYENIPMTQKPLMPFIGWDENKYQSKKKMRIGYYDDVDIIKCSVSVKRAIQTTVEALEKLGHEVVKIELKKSRKYRETAVQLLLSDGGADVLKQLKGEKYLPYYKKFRFVYNLTNFQRKFLIFMLNMLGQNELSYIVRKNHMKGGHDVKDLIGDTFLLQQDQLKIFEDNNLDAIVSPVSPIPAPLNEKLQSLHKTLAYGTIQNVTQFPAGSVPVTLVREDEQHYLNADQSNLENRLIHENQLNSKNIPVGVQISTLPLQEETCLNLMKQLEGELQFWKKQGLKL